MSVVDGPIKNRPVPLGWMIKFLIAFTIITILVVASVMCLLEQNPEVHVGRLAGWNTSLIATPLSTGVLLQHEIDTKTDQGHWAHNWNFLGFVYTDGVVAEYSFFRLAHQRAIWGAGIPTWLIFGIAILWLWRLVKWLRQRQRGQHS